MLIYDNLKANREHRRLPIGAATAAVIEAQQQRVRARYPTEPASTLKLLPAMTRNPHGRKPITAHWVSDRHREWISALPEVHIATSVEIHGKPAATMLPFDKMRIFPYAYRHTYAQCHADAGVAVDVLRELMDHRLLDTTQSLLQRRRDTPPGSCRAGHRDAVRPARQPRSGGRRKPCSTPNTPAAPSARSPFPTAPAASPATSPPAATTAPSGSAAWAAATSAPTCPTFPTWRPTWPTCCATANDSGRFIDADDWAKTEAMPSDEEITRVRRLISRVKADLDDLTDEERARNRGVRHRRPPPPLGRRARACPASANPFPTSGRRDPHDQPMIKGRQADSARRRQRVIKAITAREYGPAARSASRRSPAPQVSTEPSSTGTRTCCSCPRRRKPNRPRQQGADPWSAAPPCRPTWPTHTHASRAKPRTPGSLSASSQRSSASKPGTNRGSEPRPTSISSSGASQPSSRRSWSCQGNSRNASRSSTARGTNRELMTKLNRHI